MAPERLFKYQSVNEYSLANLLEDGLWCTAPNDFNDPSDCGLIYWKETLDDADYDRLFASQVAKFGRKVAMQRFGDLGPRHPRFRAAMNRALEDAPREQREDHRHQRGVTCFAEAHDNLLMWAHYADKHRGFCVEFDGSMEPFASAREVVYAERVPELNLVDLIDNIPNDQRFEKAMLLTKAACWSYESEWRLVHATANDRIRYPRGALKRVYLGSRISHAAAVVLTSAAQCLGVAVSRMKLVERSFSLEVVAL